MKLSLVGLGKLGLPLAACYAEAGFEVLGVDAVPAVVDAVNGGRSPLVEPQMEELMRTHGGKTLVATLEHARAIAETDITIILVATPSNHDGSFSNRCVEQALASLGEALRGSAKPYHLFVISSTVVPGSTTGSFIPLLEQKSGRKLGEGFGVCFDPDFVALGNVVKDFQNPDMVIIGQSDDRAGTQWEAIHRKMCRNQPPVARMTLINAEIAKVCLNVYVTVKISFANMVANLCERIPGADVDAITGAIGQDKRISPYYLSGGLSFGGPCFPRDTVAFKTIAQRYEADALLVEAVDELNRRQDIHLLDTVAALARQEPGRPVGILGLAFKADTPVITASSGMALACNLAEKGVPVVVFDPWAMEPARGVLGNSVSYAASAAEVLERCPLTVLTYRAKVFRQAVAAHAPASPCRVLDCWRQLKDTQVHARVQVIGMGRYLELPAHA